jgi:hypothetical protein
MGTNMAAGFATPRPSRGGGTKKVAILTTKLLITAACFWYVSRLINWGQVVSAITALDLRWTALAILVAMLQIPPVGLRWRNVVCALAPCTKRMTPTRSFRPQHVGEDVRLRLGPSVWAGGRTAGEVVVGVSCHVLIGFVLVPTRCYPLSALRQSGPSFLPRIEALQACASE